MGSHQEVNSNYNQHGSGAGQGTAVNTLIPEASPGELSEGYESGASRKSAVKAKLDPSTRQRIAEDLGEFRRKGVQAKRSGPSNYYPPGFGIDPNVSAGFGTGPGKGGYGGSGGGFGVGTPSVEQLLAFWEMFQGSFGGMGKENLGRLDERYFRHIAIYKGDPSLQRQFQTDLLAAIGRLDGELARALK